VGTCSSMVEVVMVRVVVVTCSNKVEVVNV
jgi:hypothetical protein